MRVFDHDDYRSFIRARVEGSAKGGHGQYKKMSEHLEIPGSLLSQIMSGKRDLSPESASLLCEYFSLDERESEYFLTLVEYERSGHPSLRARKKQKLELLAGEASQLERRISHEKNLTEEQKKAFYSQWYYSAIRLLTAIEGKNSIESLSETLKLPHQTVARAVNFLIASGLCVESKGKIRIGPVSTHVGNDSSMVVRHHMNWRLKALSQLAAPREHELVFTGPAVISQKACGEIKKKLSDFIAEWSRDVDQASEEKLVCLNIDWFEID